MASSLPEIRALECELVDSDCSDQELLPVSLPKSKRGRRKIVWEKTLEFDTEDEVRNYLADYWKHWKCNRTKMDERQSYSVPEKAY